MRDINRIQPIMDKLKLLWEKYPDLRFGQLITIIYHQIPNKIDMFHIEEDKWNIALDKLLGTKK